jgi:hypothetical protein
MDVTKRSSALKESNATTLRYAIKERVTLRDHLQRYLRVFQRYKLCDVWALVSQPSVKRLHQPVLCFQRVPSSNLGVPAGATVRVLSGYLL